MSHLCLPGADPDGRTAGEMPADWVPCCYGAAEDGPSGCSCWEAVYDLDQQRLNLDADGGCRAEPCADCAYRPDSPERQGADHVNGDQELLDRLVASGTPFYCHVGVRRVVEWRHPDGRTLPGSGAEYVPPKRIIDRREVAYKADGSPLDLCAGWAARWLHRG